MTYEQGFADGEHQAFKDKREHIRRSRPKFQQGPYERGWWDGYTPRDQAWSLDVQPTCWWAEREREAA
jgi:hypothetical protein